MAAYRKLEARDQEHGEQLDDKREEFVAAYAGINKGILEHFRLPIGYFTLVLVADKGTGSVSVEPILPWRQPTKLEPTPTGRLGRPLLPKALGQSPRSD